MSMARKSITIASSRPGICPINGVMSLPATLGTGLEIFRHLPDLAWFVKDAQGRFVAANSRFVDMAGLKSEVQLLGKTDFDLWPAFLAEHYVQDDARVMEKSAPQVDKIELVLRRNRAADWFATTKVPLVGPDGRAAGIAGVCRHLKKAKAPPEPACKMSAVIDHIMENYARKIEIPTLATLASLSVRQFERRFKREYGALPAQYIQRIRMEAARQLLSGSRLPIAQISRETGFYDRSHFCHQFQKHTGLTPRMFRQKHQAGARPVPLPEGPAHPDRAPAGEGQDHG
jgi:AraC-like DNA-binding protein